jgi:hypothetical protein
MVDMLKKLPFFSVKSRRIHFFRLAAVLLSCIVSMPASAATNSPWPLEYRDWSTHDFVLDQRVLSLIRSKLHEPFAPLVMAALGWGFGPVNVLQNRFFSVSGCVPHRCSERGFFWLDTRTGAGLGAIIVKGYPNNVGELRLDSKVIRGELPEQARQSVVGWLDEQDIVATAVEFVDATGTGHSLPAVATFKRRRDLSHWAARASIVIMP